ncbi:CHAD domain-containing protein [Wenjunlia vitaminophila]|uniref:CHAD domain-containing protein n=1 Tax=Wenjunlia vitaminophila TaxID=76728 RepID=UPI000382C652|nr:CHAD domain-containing protein [Wenjunlia vitaminophila]
MRRRRPEARAPVPSSAPSRGTVPRSLPTTSPDPAAPPGSTGRTAVVPAGVVLARYLNDQASAFLRALRRREDDEPEALLALPRAARRIGGALHAYQPLTDPQWASALGEELTWLVTEVRREQRHAARLDRLLGALRRLGGAADSELPAAGAVRAGALLDRQLTLARSRGHSAALRALGSARFHALADAVAVLASEVPLTGSAGEPAAEVLPPLAGATRHRLDEAVRALPLARAATAYNGEALLAALRPASAPGPTGSAPGPAGPSTAAADRSAPGTADGDDPWQDAVWHRVRSLALLSRCALEVYEGASGTVEQQHLDQLAAVLGLHRDAAEAAATAAEAARTPRIAPSTAYALGVLHADQRQEVEAARYAFSRLWQRSVPSAV